MAGFFAAINSHQSAVDADLANRLMVGLEHYGDDEGCLLSEESAVVGLHLNKRERQNLSSQLVESDCSELFVFDGRIDNRKSLIQDNDFQALATEFTLTELYNLSDAELLFAWVKCFAGERLQSVVGPFVFVFIDSSTGSVIAARDPMGGRAASYCTVEGSVYFASDETIFSNLEGFTYKLSEPKVARHLLMMLEDQPESFIDDVEVVRPGEIVRWGKGIFSRRRYYKPRFDKAVYEQSLATNAREFRRLFDQAVKRRIPEDGTHFKGQDKPRKEKVGIMLSGGLDSVPVAISASQQLVSSEAELTAFSWCFPETPEADETHLSAPLCDSLGMTQVKIDCDAEPPQLTQDFPVDPRVPFSMPFVAYQVATLKRAAQADISIILSGMHGDLLYAGAKDVIYRALMKGQVRLAIKEFRVLTTLVGSYMEAIKRYLVLPLLPQAMLSRRRVIRQRHNPTIKRMLRDSLGQKLVGRTHWLMTESTLFPRPEQYQKLFDGSAGEDAMHARFIEAPYAIERRYPLRDLELCEFVLSVPSEQLYHRGQMRPILKEAFRSEIPKSIAERNDKTLFVKPILKQIEADQSLKASLQHQEKHWAHFVKDCYFNDADEKYELRQLALWRCAYYNFWTGRTRVLFNT